MNIIAVAEQTCTSCVLFSFSKQTKCIADAILLNYADLNPLTGPFSAHLGFNVTGLIVLNCRTDY